MGRAGPAASARGRLAAQGVTACWWAACRAADVIAPPFCPPVVAQSRAARRGVVAVRSQLEDALGGAADAAPSAFHSLAAHLSTSLFLLGDAADAVAGAASTAADAAAAAGDAAPEAAKGGGFFGAFATVFESFLKVLDDGLEKLHVPYRCGSRVFAWLCEHACEGAAAALAGWLGGCFGAASLDLACLCPVAVTASPSSC